MKKIFFGLVAAMCVLALSAPVLADIKVGGMVTADMYYWNRSSERMKSGLFGVPHDYKGTNDADQDGLGIVRFAMPQAWNRWWVDYKSEDKKIAGYIQIRAGGAKAHSTNSVGNGESTFTWEYAWIDWHFNPNFYLRAGRQTQAFAIYTPDQNMGHVDGHIVGAGFGNIHGGTSRDGLRAYIKFNDMVRMEIQMLDPNSEAVAGDELNAAYPYTGGATIRAFSGLSAAVQEENTIPRFDLSIPIKIANFSIEPSLSWLRQQWDIPDGLGVGGDDSVDCWGASLGFKGGFGPFTISGEVTYGENLGFSGSYVGANTFAVPSFGVNDAGNKILIEDTKELAAWLQLAFDFGPFAIQGVIGRDRAKNDGVPNSDFLFGTTASTKTEVTTWMYGLNFPIKVAKNFTVTPNIFYYDYDGDATVGTFRAVATGDVNRDRGEELMVGVQFNLTF